MSPSLFSTAMQRHDDILICFWGIKCVIHSYVVDIYENGCYNKTLLLTTIFDNEGWNWYRRFLISIQLPKDHIILYDSQ